MEFSYITDEDIKRELEIEISNLVEDSKTDILFNGENLYSAGGGHDFLYSFYSRYLTKSGKVLIHYHYSGIWRSENKEYKCSDNGEFIEIIRPTYEPRDRSFKDMQFPTIKNHSAKLLANDLISVLPIKY